MGVGESVGVGVMVGVSVMVGVAVMVGEGVRVGAEVFVDVGGMGVGVAKMPKALQARLAKQTKTKKWFWGFLYGIQGAPSIVRVCL
jgi:hypothetical protein